MGNYPENRKSPVRLTPDQEYGVYKYAVENHCLAQTDDLFNFRVEPSVVAKEINKSFPAITGNRDITPHHVRNAVANVVDWQRRLGKLPIVPIETVELEMLRENKIKMIKELEQQKADAEKLRKVVEGLQKEIERLNKPSDAQNKIDRIRAIVSV